MTISNLQTGQVEYNLSKEFLTNGWFRYYCQLASSYSFHFYGQKGPNINKWNSCIFLIRCNRGQHWKGKQNKIQKKKIEGNSYDVKLFIQIAFGHWKKWLVIGILWATSKWNNDVYQNSLLRSMIKWKYLPEILYQTESEGKRAR